MESKPVRKVGRPKSGKRVRSTEVKFSLTPEDAEWFAELANDLGFDNRATFITGIMERLRAGGMAPVCWFRVGWQIKGMCEVKGLGKDAGWYNPLKPLPEFELADEPRPEPALPLESMAPREINKALKELKLELNAP